MGAVISCFRLPRVFSFPKFSLPLRNRSRRKSLTDWETAEFPWSAPREVVVNLGCHCGELGGIYDGKDCALESESVVVAMMERS